MRYGKIKDKDARGRKRDDARELCILLCSRYTHTSRIKISAVTEQKHRARCEGIKEMSQTGARQDEWNIM